MVAVRHLPLVAVGISLLLGTADHVLGMANSSRSPIFGLPKSPNIQTLKIHRMCGPNPMVRLRI